MLPKWLQPIENVFRKTEARVTGSRFWALFVLAGVAMIALSAIILMRRSDGGFMVEKCGELRWSRIDLPVPVWLEASDHDWEPDVKAGMAIVDPSGKLFRWAGILPEVAGQPGPGDPVITIGTGNYDDHGKANLKWDEGCRVHSVVIELPGLLLPGKVRIRASAHELGHSMGLGHSDWETSIMYPKATTLFPFALSRPDGERLAQAYLR